MINIWTVKGTQSKIQQEKSRRNLMLNKHKITKLGMMNEHVSRLLRSTYAPIYSKQEENQ